MNITYRDELLPLSPQAIYVLLAIAKQPMTGYDISRQVTEDSDAVVNADRGTVYGTLKRLSERGFIRAVEEGSYDLPNPGRPRRLYELTEWGRNTLWSEVRRHDKLAQIGRDRIEHKTYPH